ncbi:tyrosine aminotransferase [Ramicandelaber brevisporus]|nr:tyrosine aminotransferase [Ramicandelaber brevisporus]
MTLAEWKLIPASTAAASTVNPIRKTAAKLRALIAAAEAEAEAAATQAAGTQVAAVLTSSTSASAEPKEKKKQISLSIGDPTIFGNFKTDPAVVDAVSRALHSYQANGYTHECGTTEARNAVASKFSTVEAPLTGNDVILTSACSGALELAIGVLANPGQNILVPRPGFPLYQTICGNKGIEARQYSLLPHQDWQIDLSDLAAQIDDKTAAVIITNPSNPCGSVFTRNHLLEIIAVCEQHKVPIIADEIYADMVFKNAGGEDGASSEFWTVARLTRNVPVLSVGGLAKQYLVPGWRMGWILVHDYTPNKVLSQVRDGIAALATLILGPNSLIQAALPDILHKTPATFLHDTLAQLEANALLSKKHLSAVPGLAPVMPQGAMYMMVEILPADFDGIEDDIDFAGKLAVEQGVVVLPGQCFDCPNFFRICLAPPADVLAEAYVRIAEFCDKHRRKSN